MKRLKTLYFVVPVVSLRFELSFLAFIVQYLVNAVETAICVNKYHVGLRSIVAAREI